MSRINSNINSLQAIRAFSKNQGDLSTHLQRLSTGLRINTGKDDPAGLIASEQLRSEMAGIDQAVDNTTRANNVINTAEGSLSEVSSLLLELQSLTLEAANTGALSQEEIEANQLQVDSILTSINRIANTTEFNGVKLLNGSLGYTTSGITASTIDTSDINAAKLPDNGTISVSVQVVSAAQLGQVKKSVSGGVSVPTTLEIAGNVGSEQVSFAAGTAASGMARGINQLTPATGVSATIVSGKLTLSSVDYGSKSFASVKTLSGSAAWSSEKDFGYDAKVNINGAVAEVDGKVASLRTSNLDMELDLDSAFATAAGSSSFTITGGGAKFQIGSEVSRPGQINIGIGSVSTTKLGDGVVGYLSSIGSGGDNSLRRRETIQAQKILTRAIEQVSTLRGRLGALQKNVLETNINSLGVALENVTASESEIRDADFAEETAAMTRAQILVQANTSVLSQANALPQNVLSLLQ